MLHGECFTLCTEIRFLLLVIFVYSDSNLMKQDFTKTSRNSEIMKMSLVCHKLKITDLKFLETLSVDDVL